MNGEFNGKKKGVGSITLRDYLSDKKDELVKSQKWNGKVKSSKCKACES